MKHFVTFLFITAAAASSFEVCGLELYQCILNNQVLEHELSADFTQYLAGDQDRTFTETIQGFEEHCLK